MKKNEVNRLLCALALMMTGAPLVPLQSRVATGADRQDIRNSLTCLAHDWMRMLGRPVPSKVVLITSRDNKSYRDEHHLWLFVARGKRVHNVFDVEVIPQPRRVYRLVNNATIRWDGRSVHELEALLGGVWTHDVMEKNFRAALKSKPMTLLLAARRQAKVTCSSYAKHRKRTS